MESPRRKPVSLFRAVLYVLAVLVLLGIAAVILGGAGNTGPENLTKLIPPVNSSVTSTVSPGP